MALIPVIAGIGALSLPGAASANYDGCRDRYYGNYRNYDNCYRYDRNRRCRCPRYLSYRDRCRDKFRGYQFYDPCRYDYYRSW